MDKNGQETEESLKQSLKNSKSRGAAGLWSWLHVGLTLTHITLVTSTHCTGAHIQEMSNNVGLATVSSRNSWSIRMTLMGYLPRNYACLSRVELPTAYTNF